MVRTGERRARISGVFEAPRDRAFLELLETAGIEAEDGELLIEREVSSEGKSRAFAASRPITVALLKSMAPFLGDIHGQHDQQVLFSPDAQLEMLDSFAATREEAARAGELYGCWRDAVRQLEEIERSEQEKLRLLDLWSFQRSEIESVGPRPGEDAALEQERRVLQNAARLAEAANAAYSALYDSADSALARLKAALRKLDELCRIDPRLDPAREGLGPALIAVEEAAYAVRDYLAKLEENPGRLEEVESRMAALDRLKRKYGGTVEEILAFLADVCRQIEAVETAGERKAELERRKAGLASEYEALALSLGTRRKESARRLEKRVEVELASLAMERTRVQIEISPAAWSSTGADAVRFLISPNLGEEPRPLEKVASGGEISRIALALKTCVAAAAPRRERSAVPRTLVFDEVDAGIGGRAAEVVGRRLKQLASSSQVLCVTHLPQIAGFADHHFYVEKKLFGGRTAATVDELVGDARTREIGRMLSGERVTREALKQAEQLLKIGSE
jgi:DNA repair protein RecN (Recombination protein N)